jgi:hypothetical protein
MVEEDEGEARSRLIAGHVTGVEFDLHYTRSETPRTLHTGGISGDKVDNAYRSGTLGPGGWEEDTLCHGKDPTRAETLEAFFRMAISEVLHEGLEWFRIDGFPALDPHGDQSDVILEISQRCADQLWQLRERHPEHVFTLSKGEVHIRPLGPEGVHDHRTRPKPAALCGQDVTGTMDQPSPPVNRMNVLYGAEIVGGGPDDESPVCRGCAEQYLTQTSNGGKQLAATNRIEV